MSNYKTIKCPFPSCNTKIIPYSDKLHSSIIVVSESPKMVNVTTTTDVEYFKVGDMWDFDNIGVSRDLTDLTTFEIDDKMFTIERILICSECDKGPIGFAGHFDGEERNPNSLTFFLSSKSVLYE